MGDPRPAGSRRILAVLCAVFGLSLTVLAAGAWVIAPAGAEAGVEEGGATESTTTVDPSDTPTTSSAPDPTESAGPVPSDSVPSETTSATDTATASASPSEPASEATAPDDSTIEISDATLRWGINHEANTAAYNPGTYNFFSAGRLPDPGKANQFVPKRNWQQRSGNVTIEKWSRSRGRWTAATWAGLSTDSSGKPLIVGGDSQHNVVFAGGAGERDEESGTVHVEWRGSATVVFYSGYSFFYLSDPILHVDGKRGTVTAEVSGFAATRDGNGWELLPARRLEVAELSAAALTGKSGFTVTPDYAKVRVEVTQGVQKRDEAGWGAFPQRFVTYMEQMGIGSFWYSSGGAADVRKAPLPLTVSYDAADSVAPTPTATPTDTPTVENTAADPPTPTAPTPPEPSRPLPVAPQLPVDGAPGDLFLAAARPVLPEVQLVSASTTAAVEPTARGWMWWSGGAFVLLAAALALVPIAPRRT